jgi:hypothetical protein
LPPKNLPEEKIGVGGPSCPVDSWGLFIQKPASRTQMSRHDQEAKAYGMGHVFVYVSTSKQVGDPDHLKVFANADAAETWSRKTTQKAWPLRRGSGMKEAAN